MRRGAGGGSAQAWPELELGPWQRALRAQQWRAWFRPVVRRAARAWRLEAEQRLAVSA